MAPTRAPSTFEKVAETWAMIRAICHFVPIVSSLGWLVAWAIPNDTLFTYVLMPLIAIGLLAAILAAPLQFLKTAFSLTIGGWTLGWTLCPFFPMCFTTAFIGAGLGLTAGLALAIFAPAAITIYNFLKD